MLGILSIQGSTWTPGATSGLQIRFAILWLLVHGGANAVACVASLYFAPVPWSSLYVALTLHASKVVCTRKSLRLPQAAASMLWSLDQSFG